MAGSRQEFSSRWAQGGATTNPGDVKTELGWIAEKPPYQYFNWWQNRVDEMLAHYEDQGIADWDTGTTYPIGGLAMGSDDLVYRAVQSQAGIDPISDGGTSWLLLIRDSTPTNRGIIEIADVSEVVGQTNNTVALTPGNITALTPLLGRLGLIEIADQSEMDALSNGITAVTPETLGAMTVSESQRGVIALASVAEVLEGTETAKAVTPAGLGALASSHATDGFQTFAGGLIVQWGRAINVAGASHDVTLPIAFPTNHFAAFASTQNSWQTGADGAHDPGAEALNLTTIRLSADETIAAVHWLSIGT